MSRYIDADKLLDDLGLRKGITVDEIFNGIPEKCIRPMDEPHCWFFLSIILAPTADVVEVVRCKDCLFSSRGDGERDCQLHKSFVKDSDYCSYGERREDGKCHKYDIDRYGVESTPTWRGNINGLEPYQAG